MPLTEIERQITKLVVQNFLTTNQGTPRRPLITKFKAPDAVNSLVNGGILNQVDNGVLFPKVLAFHYCGDAEALHRARHSLEVVLYVLQNLFDNVEKTNFTRADIETHALNMNKHLEAGTIDLGLYLVREFGVLASWGGNQMELAQLQIAENIVNLSVDRAWDKFILQYPQYLEPAPQTQAPAPSQDHVGSQIVPHAIQGGWEQIKPLGQGGQSKVFLVRHPARVSERAECIRELVKHSGMGFNNDRAAGFAEASWNYSRQELPAELGALKVFDLRGTPEAEKQSLDRLKSETSVLSQKRPGLLKLLDSNSEEGWIVTEYYPEGSLERNPFRYKGKTSHALTAFRSLVEAVAGLHRDNIIHRDIKPANVFIGNEGQLVLGDFGIVFLPDHVDRLTLTDERVGPRDYMPPWGDLGVRLEEVHPNFDVYMLGKLLWCMITGRLRLPREWHRNGTYDVTAIFKSDPQMHFINDILDKCVVENPKNCLPSAQELLALVDQGLAVINRGGQSLAANVPRPCRVCGRGFYLPQGTTPGKTPDPVVSLRLDRHGYQIHEQVGVLYARPLICDICGNVQFFRSTGGQ